MINRKGMSAALVVIFLLLVTFVSFVVLNEWISEFSTSELAEIDKAVDIGHVNTRLDTIKYGNLSFYNGRQSNLTVQDVLINGTSCGVSGNYNPGINRVNISSCLGGSGDRIYDVVLLTDGGIYSKKILTTAFLTITGSTGGSSSTTALCANTVGLFHFNETARPFAEDNFNDNSLNTSLWVESDSEGLLSETGGELLFDSPTGATADNFSAAIDSLTNISGPSDGYVDVRYIDHDNTGGPCHYAAIQYYTIDDVNKSATAFGHCGGFVWRLRALQEGFNNLDSWNYDNSEENFRLRLHRQNSSGTNYFIWNRTGSSWRWDGNLVQGYSNYDLMNGAGYTARLRYYKSDDYEWDVAFDNVVFWDDSYSATDFSGSGLTSTVHAWSTPNGKYGNGYRFDGLGSYVRVNHSSILETNSGTVAMWFNANSTQSRNVSVGLFSKDHNNFGTGGHFSISLLSPMNSSRSIQWRYQTDASSDTLVSNNISIGTWQHLAATWNTTHVALYLNGYLANITTSNWNWSPNQEDFTIGALSSGGPSGSLFPVTHFFNGSIDEVLITNISLNASEILSLYTDTSEISCGDPTPANTSIWTSNSAVCQNLEGLFPMNTTSRPYIEDNFNDGSINTSIWNVTNTAGFLSESGGRLNHDSNSNATEIDSYLEANRNLGVIAPITLYMEYDTSTVSTPSSSYHMTSIGTNTYGNLDESRVAYVRATGGSNRLGVFDESNVVQNSYLRDTDPGYLKIVRNSTSYTKHFTSTPPVGEDQGGWSWNTDLDGYSHTDTFDDPNLPRIFFRKKPDGEWDSSVDNFVVWLNNVSMTDASSGGHNNNFVHAWSTSNGKFGEAYRLDGVGSYLMVNHSAGFQTNSGTVAVWFNPNSSNMHERMGIFSKDSLGFDDGGHLSLNIYDINLSNRTLSLRIQDKENSYVMRSDSFTLNTWNHVAVTWDLSTVRLYVNGVERNTTSENWNLTPNQNPWIIGASSLYSGDNYHLPLTHFFNGSIDDFGFWDTALSATQISTIYNSKRDISYLCNDPTNVDWWDSSYTKRKEIDISNVGSTTLVDFTAYINVSYDSDMQADYDDLRFIKGECGAAPATELNYELENYTTAYADVWVKIPEISSTGTSICMYYGNGAASSGENPSDAWDSHYGSIWHLTEGGTGNRTDSKNSLQAQTVSFDDDEAIMGKIGGADDLDGGNDYMWTSQNVLNNPDNRSAFTLSAWLRVDASTGVYRTPVSNTIGSPDARAGYAFYSTSTDNWDFWTASDDTWRIRSASPDYVVGNWEHVVGVHNGSHHTIYVNGTLRGGPSALTYDINPSGRFHIGSSWGSNHFNGAVDEVRVSHIERSADWINQSFQLVQYQSTYVTTGSEQTYSS